MQYIVENVFDLHGTAQPNEIECQLLILFLKCPLSDFRQGMHDVE